jgi:tetratricopeptide (TPR) repeat protein
VSFGLFPQVSPDGRYVIATVHESLYVQNYMDYGFLQTFYPTRGVLAFYTKASGEIRTLPGADDRRYVQTNAIWSPDGEIVVFLRAEARDAYGQGPPAERANDPRETQIQFDLYRIPFNKGMGGQAEPIPGASRNGMSNSFPRFSPDGRWIAWVKCKNGLLMRPDSKLYIMPAGGGLPRLMKCNTSRMNSWHSWSPNGKWLVFTSKCNTPYTQMFLTHVDAEGNDSPAILIPNSTAANRAVNLPEFANIPPNGLIEITAPAVDYRRHMEKGKQLTDKGLLAEAQVELEKSLELKPDYPETLVSYGYLLSEQGQKDAAVEYFRKALAIEPRFYSAYVNWGVALTQTGKFDEAIGYFKKALEIYPECDSAQYNWGVALFQSGRLDEAAMHFGRAIEIGPIYAADARSFLGLIFLQRGKPAEAIPYFRDALKAKPESSSDHYHWGMALYRLASLEEAKDHFEKALALDPKHYRSQRYLGEVLIQQGKAENAIEHYRKAIALGPAYLPSYDSLARILATHPDARLRDGEEAVRLAELACRKSNMPNPGFLDTLACAYAEAKRFEDALQTAGQAFEFSRAVRDDKLVKEIQYHQILFKKRLACHDKN